VEGAQYRTAHMALLVRQKRRADRLRRELAAEVRAAVERCPDEAFHVGCFIAAQRELDAIMARYYGRWPGDEAAHWDQVIAANTADAYATAWRMAGRVISRHLLRFGPDVLAALREMARHADSARAETASR